jgi:uncharacterized protein (TIGR02271 family)
MTREPLSRLDDWQLENDDQDVRGWPVYDSAGRSIGTVTEMVGDTETEYVEALVLDTGVEVPVREVDVRDGVVYVMAAPQEERDDAMTLSREELRVATERVPVARARLRKRVVAEQATQTVPVTHEEVRVERELIPEDERRNVGPRDVGEEQAEVILTEERPVVAKETVSVERVRLATDEVTENVQVSDEVRREEVDIDESRDRGRG